MRFPTRSALLCFPCMLMAAEVVVESTPDGGLQPQAALDSRGALHLIYFKGDPMAGDIFYVKRKDGGFSDPKKVNSRSGSVLAIGTMRGPQMALGKDGSVHVAWMGSKKAEPARIKGEAETPMVYARLKPGADAFEAERNVMTWASGLDGGGTVTADQAGNVYVVWHANGQNSREESQRAVYVARSADGGNTFDRERRANTETTGSCACCGIRAFAGTDGEISILYRTAVDRSNRDMALLRSFDGGKTFTQTILNRWKVNTCPASTAALNASRDELLAAWESENGVQGALIKNDVPKTFQPAGSDKKQKFPSVARGMDGAIVLAWIESAGWGQSGNVAWQTFDSSGKPASAKKLVGKSKVWSFATVVPQRDGKFILFY